MMLPAAAVRADVPVAVLDASINLLGRSAGSCFKRFLSTMLI